MSYHDHCQLAVATVGNYVQERPKLATTLEPGALPWSHGVILKRNSGAPISKIGRAHV